MIRVTYFRFGLIAARPDEVCVSVTEGGEQQMSYQIAGGTSNANATPPDEGSRVLGDLGWYPQLQVRDFARNPDGSSRGEPAALGRAGMFDSLSLDFVTATSCVHEPSNACKMKRVRLTVEYDGRNQPSAKAFESAEVDCNSTNPSPDIPLVLWETDTMRDKDDDNVRDLEGEWFEDATSHLSDQRAQMARRVVQDLARRANLDQIGERKRVITFPFRVSCAFPARPGPVRRDASEAKRFSIFDQFTFPVLADPCDFFFEVEYNYFGF